MKLLLFDIDGTLITAGGAALRAAGKAFENIYNVKNVMDGITADGKTDYLILQEMFKNGLGRDYTKSEADAVFSEYLSILDINLGNGEQVTVLPGINDLLGVLTQREDIILGIATGNVEEGAWIKLKHGSLDGFFSFGGFGSDSENREKLVRAAIDRGMRFADTHLEAIYVIGDTPLDIIHGRAAGALTVGVSTGRYSMSELQSHRPDYLFSDFVDTNSFLGIL